MIRVLYTINNLDTAGLKLVVANLVRNLDRERFTPLIGVRRKSGSPLEREMEKICQVIELPLHISSRPRLAFPRKLLAASRALLGIADIGHSFDYSSDWTESLAMRLAGIPWVTTKTNMNYHPQNWWLRCLLASRIVCLSSAQAQVLQNWRRKIVTIPIGIDVERFQNAKPLRRADYNLVSDDLLLVCVAYLVPVKRHVELLHAFASVANELPRIRLILVGPGEKDYTRQLTNLAASLQVQDRIIFWGSSSQVPEILKMCDGTILASQNEGFAAALVEAMAAGLPVIATRCGGPDEIVIDGETGWLVDVAGFEPLARAMRSFYNDPEQRRRFSQAAQRRASQLYTKELMVQRYETLYNSLLG